ncbi:hypothetical protein BGX38DRAFT_1192532 [Terfezia claveryi]|nr:hypothetical protein BGX38DRAFT_1192532 [Terfezia claveryi]
MSSQLSTKPSYFCTILTASHIDIYIRIFLYWTLFNLFSYPQVLECRPLRHSFRPYLAHNHIVASWHASLIWCASYLAIISLLHALDVSSYMYIYLVHNTCSS